MSNTISDTTEWLKNNRPKTYELIDVPLPKAEWERLRSIARGDSPQADEFISLVRGAKLKLEFRETFGGCPDLNPGPESIYSILLSHPIWKKPFTPTTLQELSKIELRCISIPSAGKPACNPIAMNCRAVPVRGYANA